MDFLARWIEPGVSPMCGNSICQDRRFLAREMPELERYFHYRNLDVSTLKELARRWAPEAFSGFQKSSTHLALDDIRDSIRELHALPRAFLRVSVKPHSEACERNREPDPPGIAPVVHRSPALRSRSAPAPGSTPCISPPICRISLAADGLRGRILPASARG